MKTILKNRKINFDYEIIEEFKAGLVLEGWQVKSLRQGKVSSSDGLYVRVLNGIPVLMGLHIKALNETNTFKKIDENPTLKLLLTKREINKMFGSQNEKGLTMVLKELFFEKNLIKARIAIVKGKTSFDKRNDLKKKEMDREADKAIKSKNL